MGGTAADAAAAQGSPTSAALRGPGQPIVTAVPEAETISIDPPWPITS